MKTINAPALSIPSQEEQETDLAAHQELALTHYAMHVTQIGISHWTNGTTYMEFELSRALGPLPQSAWFSAANRNFQEWLTAGGFSQQEQEGLPEAPAQSPTPEHPQASCVQDGVCVICH